MLWGDSSLKYTIFSMFFKFYIIQLLYIYLYKLMYKMGIDHNASINAVKSIRDK